MSFTIRSISIYSVRDECRTLKFRKSGLNILTGRAKTGKSSIIDILDYCFGRRDCYVAEGVIRRYVSWFGVEIENGEDVLFIGRRNPGQGRRTSPDIYIRRGRHDSLPMCADLKKNITEEALIRLLTRFSGIAENENRPLSGTRGPLQATIRHALFMCFQKQDEIASRDRLFHRQGDQFIPQAIKDTFPYFLGAVDEDHFLRQNELDDAKLTLQQLEARRSSMQDFANRAQDGIRRLLLDARRVGLVDEDFETSDVEYSLQELRRVFTADFHSPSIVSSASETITRLESELHTLHQQLDDVQNDIRSTKHFIREQTSYSMEVSEQHARLSSLNLYTGTSDTDDVCPLCHGHLETPTSSVADLSMSLRNLELQLDAVVAERPHLQKRLDEFGKKRTEIDKAIVETQRDLERAYGDNEKARLQRDQVIERARVVGRIGAILDQASPSVEMEELTNQIEERRRLVEVLAERIHADDIDERVITFLNLIADYMTDYATVLNLEHAEGRIRLDLKKLSVVAETVAGPIPLERIGSGENWVGYHVVTLLALHRWFREQNRPVPGILVFDQPSQAHYPPDTSQSDSIESLQDADRRAVHSLFQLMHKASQQIGDGFQLIVLDHAHLDDDWFNEDIVEEWRGDAGLVPIEWTSS